MHAARERASSSAAGSRLIVGRGTSGDWITVVAVVGDLRYRSLTVDATREPDDPDIYFPYAQRPDRTVALVASTSASPALLIPSTRGAIQRFDRDVSTFAERAMSGLIADRMAAFRLSAGIMSFFGMVALVLAGIAV